MFSFVDFHQLSLILYYLCFVFVQNSLMHKTEIKTCMVRVFFNIERIVIERLKLKVGGHGNAAFFTQKKKRGKIKKTVDYIIQ